jgi:hypothetical protein
MNKEDLKLNIDLKNTQPILSPEGNQVFAEGVILRKISRFVSGTDEDAIMPIPVFYDIQTGKVLVDTLPKDLRAEFSDEQED